MRSFLALPLLLIASPALAQSLLSTETARWGHAAIEVGGGYAPAQAYQVAVDSTLPKPARHEPKALRPLLLRCSYGISELFTIAMSWTIAGGKIERKSKTAATFLPWSQALGLHVRAYPYDLWRLSPYVSAGLEVATIDQSEQAQSLDLALAPAGLSALRVPLGAGVEAKLGAGFSLLAEAQVSRAIWQKTKGADPTIPIPLGVSELHPVWPGVLVMVTVVWRV